jgi:probable F420-dependent oxidoreductase
MDRGVIPGRLGLWSIELRRADGKVVRELAAELEELGYSAFWLSGGAPGVFEAAGGLLAATTRTVVATGVISIWTQTAERAAEAWTEFQRLYPDRFLLGIGVGHGPVVNKETPGRYQYPVAAMTRYLDELDGERRVPPERRVLAALSPLMLGLARNRAIGTHPYLVTPEHTARIRELIGPDAFVAPEQAVVISEDANRARDLARRHLKVYFGLPNYVNNWFRLGFDESDLAGGGSDRLVDALVAWGSVETVTARVDEHFQAGADHVALQVLGGSPADPPRLEWRLLAEALILKSGQWGQPLDKSIPDNPSEFELCRLDKSNEIARP